MILLKKNMFSAVQPSGNLTLGNYIGSISQWVHMQDIYHCMYSIADLHAMTIFQDKVDLQNIKLDILSIYLSAGIDPKKSVVFMQSSIAEHCQLYWVLSCYSYFGELTRMTQFKHKSKIFQKNINCGLFSYPILMAADILLYHSDVVLVGKDQIQHLELTRTIANRFNKLYCHDHFKVPDICIPNQHSAKIMSLLNPMIKMSKSDINKNNVIFLMDSKDLIFKKINRSVTDSENKIFYDIKKKPGISNLLNIYSSLTGDSVFKLEKKFFNTSYKDFKYILATLISQKLSELQERFYFFRNQESFLKDILCDGATQAKKRARRNIKIIYDILGLL
ncbi:tryptophan--tRNA ligase [Buchnera aphidicola]|uniref:tryptophan--tRNA ligase n=1 Tax=Buchnera aphidicola TaxID=9 RepID=UPI0031B882A4